MRFSTWILRWLDTVLEGWEQEPIPPLPDCLLCPGKAMWDRTKLLGMDVCWRCAQLHLHDARGNWVELVPRDIMLWGIKVNFVRNEQALHNYPLRVATRMTLARIMGLEVDLADLHDFSYPGLEVEI